LIIFAKRARHKLPEARHLKNSLKQDGGDDDDDGGDDDNNGDENGGVRFHRGPLAAVGISNCLRLQNHPSIIFL